VRCDAFSAVCRGYEEARDAEGGGDWQKREVVGSTGISVSGDGVEVEDEGGEVAMAIAIAVDICWAITQPTIFSRCEDVFVPVAVEEIRFGRLENGWGEWWG